jgi:hypothetical protein
MHLNITVFFLLQDRWKQFITTEALSAFRQITLLVVGYEDLYT